MSNSGNSAVSTPPNDAQVKVFKPPSGNAGESRCVEDAPPKLMTDLMVTAAPPPPPADNGLKPTSAELKSAFQDHIQQRHGPDAPMMTKAMREKEEAKRRVGRKVYSEVKIRVRFADRTQLETSLPVTEKLPSIYGFVRNSLNTAAQQTPFTLFTSPPKTDYKESDKRTLRELGFVPAAVLSVRWENAAFNSKYDNAISLAGFSLTFDGRPINACPLED